MFKMLLDCVKGGPLDLVMRQKKTQSRVIVKWIHMRRYFVVTVTHGSIYRKAEGGVYDLFLFFIDML